MRQARPVPPIHGVRSPTAFPAAPTFLFHHNACLHHENDPFESLDAGERIFGDGDHVGVLPWLQGADLVLKFHDACRG